MKGNIKKLVFVYNADSGLFNSLSDITHKIISPTTYECQLCNITHSYLSMHRPWASFLETLDAELEFLHRDELTQKYGQQNTPLPAIFLQQDNQLSLAVSASEINQCNEIDALKILVEKALE